MIRPELISPVIAGLMSSLSLLLPANAIAQPSAQRCEGGYCYEMRCEPGRPQDNCRIVSEQQCRPVTKNDCRVDYVRRCKPTPYQDCRTRTEQSCRTTVDRQCRYVVRYRQVRAPGCRPTPEFPCPMQTIPYRDQVCSPRPKRTCTSVPKRECRTVQKEQCGMVAENTCRKRVEQECRMERRQVCDGGRAPSNCREVRTQRPCAASERWTPQGCVTRQAEPAPAPYSPPQPPPPPSERQYQPPDPPRQAEPAPPPPPPSSPSPEQQRPDPPPRQAEGGGTLPSSESAPTLSLFERLGGAPVFIGGGAATVLGLLVLLAWRRSGRSPDALRRQGVVVRGRPDQGQQEIAPRDTAGGPQVTLRAVRGPVETGVIRG
jgi:hypothetical protein